MLFAETNDSTVDHIDFGAAPSLDVLEHRRSAIARPDENLMDAFPSLLLVHRKPLSPSNRHRLGDQPVHELHHWLMAREST